jgi:hypothetical protein
MVDRNTRDQLTELVRHFGSGQITTDYFAMAGGKLVEATQDYGVGAVYAWAEGLHSDALWPIRLRGAFRLTAEDRRRLTIAILFLYSDMEYEWPPSGPKGAWTDFLLAYACGAFIFAGLMLFVLSLLSVWCMLGAIASLFAAIYVYKLSHRLVARNEATWKAEQAEAGRDWDIWPFLKHDDFEEAKRQPRLLCGL